MMVHVLEKWLAEFQAQPRMEFKDDEGNAVVIPEQDAGTAWVARVALLGTLSTPSDPRTGMVVDLRIPEGYENKGFVIGATLNVDLASGAMKTLNALERILKVKSVTRTLPPAPGKAANAS